MFKKLLSLFLILTLLSGITVACLLYWFVVLHPGPEIKRDNIHSILGKESPVFYSDGITRLGVFFDQAHRQYVSYDEIPVNFINAMVASEDNLFFYHIGFDVIGIIRAAIKNIQAKRIVQGGSTLTQQTAKNLFKRTDRSIKAKFKELLFALRLEYHYKKEEIFEFYANQFYVSGNAHGLGVAARYYFDKSPSELSLLECSFIAGSVKKPNAYNPFIKKTRESSALAKKRGKARVIYVLENMYKLGMIDKEQLTQGVQSEVIFNKGKVGFALDHVMEMVRDAVSSNEILEELAAHGITNVATSGVRVITTVDKNIQDKILHALRHDLSRIDVRMRGYQRNEVQEELAHLDYKGDGALRKNSFLFGKVSEVLPSATTPVIKVTFGDRLGDGSIDKKGLKRIALARLRWQKNPWSELKKNDYVSFLKEFQVGDTVWVSVREIAESGDVILDLEKFPKIDGGALVLQGGTIKAMAGGVENRFFNRAIDAKRTMGSAFKPFVYTAALQLGWSGVDELRNKRALFVFQGQPYFPRPDHTSPHDFVSMSWAGVHSENVATVWLLSHLCDKLSSEDFREVARQVGLSPKMVDGESEPYGLFRSRIRDKYGIVVTKEILWKTAFEQALKNVESDFVFEGLGGELKLFQDLHYGLNFDRFEEAITLQLEQKEEKLKAHVVKELLLRKKILSSNYLLLSKLRRKLENYIVQIQAYIDNTDTPVPAPESGVTKKTKVGLYYNKIEKGYTFIQGDDLAESFVPVHPIHLWQIFSDFSRDEKETFWQKIRLQSQLSVAGFDVLEKQVELEFNKLLSQSPYSMEVLDKVHDYRVMVGLQYLVDLAKELGVNSRMEPVLSLPLGSNVVTLLEAVRMYEGLVTGSVIVPGVNEYENRELLTIIDRIESDNGEVLFRPKRVKRTLLAPETTLSVGHILENIVKFGTGRYANSHVKLFDNSEQGKETQSFSIPLLGKTGTANRYTNASFFGYLPGLSEKGDSVVHDYGYAVGVYVGYDDNTAMRKGRTRITGSQGALPIWSDIVDTLLHEKNYEKKLDPVDLSFYGLILKRRQLGQSMVGVSTNKGGLMTSPVIRVDEHDRFRPSILTFGRVFDNGSYQEKRYFQPFWKYLAQPNYNGESLQESQN